MELPDLLAPIVNRRSEAIRELETELAARSLPDFVRQAWQLIEPATPLVWNWHLDLICEYLEAVTAGEIRNLIINEPPRHGKSTVACVMWPAWVWTTRPAWRWIFASYAADLATRDSVKCRRIIESPWYGARWGDVYRLTSDQNVKTRFENDSTGYRISTSVGGSATGEGGDTIVVDDPHNLKEIHSQLKRQTVMDWWDQVMSTRVNNPKTVSKVIIMQRGHDADLAGHLERQGSYDVLKIPTIAERRSVFRFPRSGREYERMEGDLLWPARFGEAEVETAKRELGTYGWSAQHQQRPTPEGGGILKREWWKFYRDPPEFTRIIQSWDTAYKKGQENDPTVGTTWGEAVDGYYLLWRWRGWVEFPELKRAVLAEYARFEGRPAAVLIEDKASGQSLIQELKRDTRLPVLAIGLDSDKVARANAVSPTVEAGRVFLPEGAPWLAEFLDEMDQFPRGEHDDQVDSSTQYLMWALGISKNSVAEPNVRSI